EPMIKVVSEPQLPAKPGAEPVVQCVRLVDNATTIAVGWWHASGGADGVVQIVDLHVTPGLRRKGIGGQMLEAVIAQAGEYYKRRRVKFRQIWIGVAQTSEVIGRAFLMEHNFHHIGTVAEIYREQYVLIFTRSMDGWVGTARSVYVMLHRRYTSCVSG